jgi:hypothetical protein
LYLCDDSETVIDYIQLPKIENDDSFQRVVENGTWRVLKGTPGEEYAYVCEKPVDNVNKPTILMNSGFYGEPIQIEIQSSDNCEIHYTLDGSTPTASSPLYMAPLMIKDISGKSNIYSNIKEITLSDDMFFPEEPVQKATILKAITIADNSAISSVSSATFFIGYDKKIGYNSLPTISLVFDEDDLFSWEKGIYVLGKVHDMCKEIPYDNYVYTCPTNYNCEGLGWQRNVQIAVFDENGNCVSEEDAKAEIHGGWSRANTQKSFNLLDIHSDAIDQMFGRTVESLVLHAGQNHESIILDKIAQNLVSDRDITTQQAYLVQVFINGEYWGVYLLQDRISKDLISDRYDIDEDNIILIKNNNVVSDDESYINKYQELLDFATNNDLSMEENYKVICNMMDVQSYIDYVSCEVYLGNCDSFNNNYGLWRTKDKKHNNLYADNRWRWVLYDTEVGCRIASNQEESGDSFSEGGWSIQPTEVPLFKSLLNNNDFKTRFVESFYDIANSNYDKDCVNKMIDEVLKINTDAVINSIIEDHRRFYSADYSKEDYMKNIQDIRLFFETRNEYILPKLRTEIAER